MSSSRLPRRLSACTAYCQTFRCTYSFTYRYLPSGLRVIPLVVPISACSSSTCRFRKGCYRGSYDRRSAGHRLHRHARPALRCGRTYQRPRRPVQVRQRRDLVEEISGGRIGYVHVQGMNDRSYRTTYSEIMGRNFDKDAIIVDTRFNGGGWLHDDLVVLLGGMLGCGRLHRRDVPGGDDRLGRGRRSGGDLVAAAGDGGWIENAPGVAARMARGCTSGQGLSGGATRTGVLPIVSGERDEREIS